MFGFAIFCVQIFLVQHAFSQAVTTQSNINNGISSSFGPMHPGLGAGSMAAANMGAGLAGQMIANGIPGAAYNQIGAQPHGIAPGQMGLVNGQMGLANGQIGLANGQMGLANGQMGLANGQMVLANGQMGVAPSQMGIAPGQMGIAPGQMGIAPGQMGIAAGQMGIAASQMGVSNGMAANPLAAGYGPNYGGSGSGDVAVAGELPVAGTTSITGQVPMSGKVQFTGTLPAGGVVTISGQCGGAANNVQLNAPYGAKPGYNNKQYLY